MTDKNRLIELFQEMDKDFSITCPKVNMDKNCKGCKYKMSGALLDCNYFERKVDYLLANGVIVPPCKVGDTVYVITDCSHIMMYYDNDYLTGTGAIECPFEDVCNFTDCNDENTQVLETYVNFMGCEDGSEWFFCCEHINGVKDFNEIGKTVFLTKEEAELRKRDNVND